MTATRPETPLTRPLDRAVDATAGRASALTFAALSALRGRRSLHPLGAAFAATVEVRGASCGVPLLDQACRRPAIVRLSRAVGIPEPWPDVFGLAIRILDAHGPGMDQDLLVSTSAEPPGLRHLVVPARGHAAGFYSSILRLQVGGGRLLVGARARGDPGGSGLPRMDDVASASAEGRLSFEVVVADRSGPWRPVADVTLGRRLDAAESEALSFNPFRGGGGIRPVGAFNALRRRSYRASQAARPGPGDPGEPGRCGTAVLG